MRVGGWGVEKREGEGDDKEGRRKWMTVRWGVGGGE